MYYVVYHNGKRDGDYPHPRYAKARAAYILGISSEEELKLKFNRFYYYKYGYVIMSKESEDVPVYSSEREAENTRDVKANGTKMYVVYDNDTPAILTDSIRWKVYKYKTLAEAEKYAIEWLGIYVVLAEEIKLELNTPYYYSEGDYVVIREESEDSVNNMDNLNPRIAERRFWIVWTMDKTLPIHDYSHATYEEAKSEAKRLAERFQGTRFYVVECKEYAISNMMTEIRRIP